MRLNRIAFFATLLTILCLGASFNAWADDDDIETYGMPQSHDFIQHRTYIGFFGTSADIDNNNDFSGYEGFLTFPVSLTGGGFSNVELDYIPTINRNFGFGGLVGHREGPWAVELSYWYSNHTASVYSTDALGNPITFTTSGVYTTINIDIKRYFFTTFPIQPFIDLGFNFAYLSSHNTSELFSYDSADGLFDEYVWSGDQTDTGYGLNLGIGGELYLGDGFSMVGGVVQRFTTFQQINGVTKSNLTPDPGDLPLPGGTNSTTNSISPGLNQGSLEGNGLNIYLGMTVGIDQ
jgi:hypothetical protein